MGIDFNAEFAKLNTNTVGDSANRLDADECQAAKMNGNIWTVAEGMTAEQFKEANQHCSEYDTNQDGVVTVREQKASIADQLKNVWTSSIARFFKDDISYNNSNANSAQSVTQKVMARIQNALSYIQYAKDNNIDIFDDNTGTGVDDKDGKPNEYTDSNGNKHLSSKNVKFSVVNEDGTRTNTYNDGHTETFDKNFLGLKGTNKDGTIKFENNYNEDGSATQIQNRSDGSFLKIAIDQNDNQTGYFRITAKGNYKAQAKQGETFMATLTRLGITDAEDIKAVQKANPKAFANKYFRVDVNDVYIPKEVIANMKANGTYDEDKLMGKTV